MRDVLFSQLGPAFETQKSFGESSTTVPRALLVLTESWPPRVLWFTTIEDSLNGDLNLLEDGFQDLIYCHAFQHRFDRAGITAVLDGPLKFRSGNLNAVAINLAECESDNRWSREGLPVEYS